ncbi:hypothetical protein [Serratia proteamaculans]|uniref:hypothetical protein n=1 Tax=Serratia proteamaculans TaxID=28151 RepID=UPI00101F2D58|nr:hypothetical protein [Serratia proteamaculans]RYM48034.1 hypothetical protein BSQ97_22865 [Serratia proteamaculans]
MSTEKLSELNRQVAWTWNAYGMQHVTTEADESAELILDGVDVTPLYSQEYVSALLAELEAKTKHIADMEHVVAAAKCDDELWDAMAHRLKTLEDKLATPVRLPEKFSMLHRTDFHEDYHSTMAFKSVEVFDAIRAADFTFTVGDEQ